MKEVSVTFSPQAHLLLSSTLQRLLHQQQQQQQHRHIDRDQVASKELKMYGSPWSAPAWMKSNNALNGQVILFFFNGQVIIFSINELSDTIMDLTYVSNRVTFFQSITNNGLTIMSSEKRSLTPIYLCPCVHCRYCIYPDYHLIEQSLSHYVLFRNPFVYGQRNPFSKLLHMINTKITILFLCQVPQCLR